MFGFIRVASATPHVNIGDCAHNAKEIIEIIERAKESDVSLLVLPELSITGYTCGDLFHQTTLIQSAEVALTKIAAVTKGTKLTIIVGLPYLHESRLYNVAAVCSNGLVKGLVPKTFLPNYGVFCEKRFFTDAFSGLKTVYVNDENNNSYEVPFGTNLIFSDESNKNIQLAVEICEDGQAPVSPSTMHAQNGAILIANLSASDESVGKNEFRHLFIKSLSSRLICSYIYANAGKGESSTDLVFSGNNMIAENGAIVSEAVPFAEDTFCVADIDCEQLSQRRLKNTTFRDFLTSENSKEYKRISVTMPELTGKLERYIDPYPFIPMTPTKAIVRCDEILSMLCAGMIQRFTKVGAKSVVVGISGGLDSTLVLLILNEVYKKLGLDNKTIITVTMPCFGTTDRTYYNAINMAKNLGTDLREIPIAKTVEKHFEDIGHDKNNHDVTYANSQARERTQVLMDIANATNGIVIGTGDLSELALGWATYNGDHMSMYSLNASIPKTLVRYLVRYFEATAVQNKNQELASILHDVIETPVSPELLPDIENGASLEETEQILGAYDLHDFYLYYHVRWGFSPDKILYLAEHAFKCGTDEEMFSKEEIHARFQIFIKRFFSQQFKRSCIPDGPKVGPVSLSPRGPWIMPSDASVAAWLK